MSTREIKFRGKRKDNGKWEYGDLCTQDKVYSALIGVWRKETLPYCEWIPVDEESVGQFTGIKDKQGKEIYEGDIVRCDDIICAVTWKDAAFHIITNEAQGASVFVQDRARRFEIIGNQYEHPSLIKQ